MKPLPLERQREYARECHRRDAQHIAREIQDLLVTVDHLAGGQITAEQLDRFRVTCTSLDAIRREVKAHHLAADEIEAQIDAAMGISS